MRIQHCKNNSRNTKEHDNSLDEVVHRCGFITTDDDVDGSQNRHDNDTVFIGDVETHLEQSRYATVNARCIGNQENEGDDGSYHAQPLIIKTCSKKIGHGARLNVLRHQFRAASKDEPRQQRTDNGISYSNPCGGKAVTPSELSGIAYEDHRREITRTIGKGCQPWTNSTTAQNETIYTACLFA